MGAIKSLAKDTAIYGLSSIIGRFLNWLLVPLYTNIFDQSEYGVVSYIYSIVALALVILTYGMETGFFRFANHERYSRPDEVYGTAITSLSITSLLFMTVVTIFIFPISRFMECPDNPVFALLMAYTVAIDAYTCIPFAWLRYQHRPMRFATLKLVGIGLNIGFNLFFLLLCPWLWENDPGLIEWFYDPDFRIGYIFLSNMLSSSVTVLLLAPEAALAPWGLRLRLWREMLSYSWPLLLFGIAGIMNQTIGNILLPWILPDKATAMAQLGIYGANYKIAIVMVMFIQAFRFAYEPFIFAKGKGAANGTNSNQSTAMFADTMKYFVIFSMVIFLGVMAYIDILRHFIGSNYFSGLKVVPVLMIAEFFFGVFFNLSLWYKLTDRTIWGTWFSLIGLAVTIVMLLILVPRIGYMGCAWAALGCYGVMMLTSYLLGRKKFPVPYQTTRLSLYFIGALAAYGLMCALTTGHSATDMGVRTILLLIYIAVAVKCEHITFRTLLPRRN